MTSLSLLQQALYTIRKLKQSLQEKTIENMPIAIVGLACRFPHASNKKTFWQMLAEEKNAISKLPEQRWHLLEGTQEQILKNINYPYWGGYLNDIDKFDANFFGITPREAQYIDPQQRLLIEVAYEALEDAGFTLAKLLHSNTGVFIGCYGSEFIQLLNLNSELDALYLPTGNAASMAANRISYLFNLQGPSLTIDTACSSSLMALHLACQQIRLKECEMALVGGVNLNLLPSNNYLLSQAKMLSPDGQCKTFDASANGYVQGEGVGVVIIKSLAKALEDNDRIYAVIAGSAANQDGKTNGLTAPNGAQQEKLLRAVYAACKIDPAWVGYIECHGTGTYLGDPIEVEALGHIIGKSHVQAQPCWIGSVKTNIGHLEPAAGITSVIKMALALQHKKIPSHINIKNQNPLISFEQYNFKISRQLENWPIYGKYRVGGINGFGFGGTNVHVVMREITNEQNQIYSQRNLQKQPWEVFTLSAKDETALQLLIASWIKYLSHYPEISLAQWCYNLHIRREHYPHRIAIVTDSVINLRTKLLAYQETGLANDDVLQISDVELSPLKITYWISTFTNLNLLIKIYRLHKDRPIFIDAIARCITWLRSYNNNYNTEFETLLEQSNIYRKNDIFLVVSITYALCQLWKNWNLSPQLLIAENISSLCLSLVLAGACEIETILQWLANPQMVKSNLINQFIGKAKISIILIKDTAKFDGENLLIEKIDLEDTHNILLNRFKNSMILRFDDNNFKQYSAKHLQPYQPNQDINLLEAKTLAKFYINGYSIDWDQVENQRKYKMIDMPSYPWQHKSHWPKLKSITTGMATSGSPLLGEQIHLPLPTKQFKFIFDVNSLPELGDTKRVLHVGYYVEMLGFVVQKVSGQMSFVIETINFFLPIVVPANEPLPVYLMLQNLAEGRLTYKFYTQDKRKPGSWIVHAQGDMLWSTELKSMQQLPFDIKEIVNKSPKGNGADFADRIKNMQMPIGNSIQWVTQYWQEDINIICKFRKSQAYENADNYSLKFPPGLFDGCIQPLFLLLDNNVNNPYITTKINNLKIQGIFGENVFLVAELKLVHPAAKEFIGGWYLVNDKNDVLVSCVDIHLSRFNQQAFIAGLENNSATSGKFTISNLKSFSLEERRACLIEFLKDQVAIIFQLPVTEIPLEKPLHLIGMDSLMAAALGRKIEEALDLSCPLQELMKPINIYQVADYLLKDMCVEAPSSAKPRAGDSPWVAYFYPKKKARLRLICFPYGGSGASIYREWNNLTPDEIEVLPIQLPGRENRYKEPAIINLSQLVVQLAGVLEEYSSLPYAFFGHSFGSLIAFELAHYLHCNKQKLPKHLIVSAYPAPQHPLTNLQNLLQEFAGLSFGLNFNNIAQVTDEQLEKIATILKKYHLAYDGSTNINFEAFKVLLPVLLADSQLVASYEYLSRMPLSIPITAFFGDKDKWIDPISMKGWKEHTVQQFQLLEFFGDHLFIKEKQQQDTVITRLVNILSVYFKDNTQSFEHKRPLLSIIT